MSNISLFDYVKFNFLHMRTPELMQKMKLQELYKNLNSNKYKFINQKLNALSVDCASFIYDLYKTLYPILPKLKEDMNSKEQNPLITCIVESILSDEQKQLANSFEKEHIINRVKSGESINNVFTDIKSQFKKFQQSVTQEQTKSMNSIYNSLKNFSELSQFDFYMFLKFFAPSLVEGSFAQKPTFKPSTSVQAVDDLVKLDSGLNAILITDSIIPAIKFYQNFREITPAIDEKDIKSTLIKIKYLQKTELLSDVIKYMLKDFFYKTISNSSNENIYISYIASFTETLKHSMESIIKDIKNEKISGVRRKMFEGISIIPLTNISENYNSMLEKYELSTIESVEPLEYLQTFVIEIYNRYIQKEENELCVSAEFVNPSKQKLNMDAYYYINTVREKISKLDEQYDPSTSEGKKLKLILASKQKAQSNAAMLDIAITKIDEEGSKIIVEAFNAIVDMSTVLKNVVDDIKNTSQKTIKNPAKLLRDSKINFDVIEETLPKMDEFINLMKYFIR